MSIFDPTSGMNALPWIQEKALSALEEAARLVDLANENDTSPWYAKELRRRAGAMIARLAPLVALVHGAGEEAASSGEWSSIAERGAFSFAAWCKKHGIQDPRKRSFSLLAVERDDEEAEEMAARPLEPEEERSALAVLDLRCTISASLARRLVWDELPAPARKLLHWALSHLEFAERPDVVALSKRFLPTDIGVTPEEASLAYRTLIERGLIERVDLPASSGDQFALRLVAEGVNESKQPLPYEPITFGFPGARVGGHVTFGNELRVSLPAPYAQLLSRWQFRREDEQALGAALQAHLGADRAFIEQVRVDPEEPAVLSVRLRYPWDQSDETMREALTGAALAWVRQRVAPSLR